MQQQIQQLELQKLEAEIAVLQSEAMENQAKAQVQSTKVGVETSRAASLKADADIKSAKFVADMDGTNHQRELEKEQAKQEGILANTKLAKEADMQIDIARNLTNQMSNLAKGNQ